MGDKLKSNLLIVCLISCIVLLFGSISALFLIDSKPVYNVQTGHAVSSQEVSQIIFEPVQNGQTGVLIKTENLDYVVEQLTSKGVSAKKHKAGKVIAANIPTNILNELETDDSIQILPNRMVQAFSVDGIEQINLESFSNDGITGKGIKIAVLDSGITNKENMISEKDFTGSGTTNDLFNHGDKIYEVISAVSPDAEIINTKVLDNSGFGTEAGIVAGINYAIEQNADVISISAGGLFDDLSSPMVSAVEDAVSQGIVVVAAAGNCGECGSCGNFVGVATPGNSPNAITVGSVFNDEAVCISGGKNYGSYIKPDVAAPGLTTSISTPFVSSAAALILEKYSANPSQVKSLIEQNAFDLGAEGKDAVFGSGKLNLQLTAVDVPIIEEEIPEAIELPETNYNNRPVVAFGNPTTRLGDWSMFSWPVGWISSPPKSALLDDTFGFIFWCDYVIQVNHMELGEKYEFGGCGIYDIEIVSPTEAYLISDNSIRIFNGTNWADETLPSNAENVVYVTADSNSSVVFAGGFNSTKNGYIIKRQEGTWNLESADFLPIFALRFLNSTTALAIGQLNKSDEMNISFYKWEAGTWSTLAETSSSTRGRINSMEVISNDLAYAVGNKGTIMKWDGVSWEDVAVGLVSVDLNDLSFYDSNNGFA
ncbi:S8 family serine peptidase, partial [Candidatus Woesearchaeota archaeon]|nr:S8 family serine peptidase [Candidatus Woesearchaeota archaeon]